MKTLLGTKVGMTQILSEDGVAIPVTLIKAGPVTVTQVKTVEVDGYTAVQLGYGNGKNLSNAVAGHVKKAGVTPKTIREVRIDDLGELKVGDAFDVAIFEVGDNVDVTVKALPEPLSATTTTANVQRTVVKEILVKSVLSALCILSEFLKERLWPVIWVTSK